MRKTKLLYTLVILAAVAVVWLISIPQRAFAYSHPNHVLILNAYNFGFRWSEELLFQIEKEFYDYPDTTLYFEHLDTKKFAPEQVFEPFKEYLKVKYSTHKPTIIISCDDNALDFLKLYREELFPDIPIVFCGVNNFSSERITGISNITGANELQDIAGTIDIGLRQNPGTNRVIVVYDQTLTGINTYKLSKEQAERFANRVNFEYWTNLSFEDLAKKLKSLKAGNIVLALNYVVDVNGKRKTNKEYVDWVVENSPVPVYNPWKHNIGYGIIGGKVIDPQIHGKVVANLAKRVIEGENADSIPVIMDCPSRYIFDYNALKKFNITNAIPDESLILYQPFSLYREHKQEFLIGTTSFIILAVLVVVLYKIAAKKTAALKQVEETEKRFRTLFEKEPDTILMCDPETYTVVDANLAAESMFGRSRDELIGLDDAELFIPEEREKCYENYKKYVEIGQSGPTEPMKTYCLRADGQQLTVELITQNIIVKGKPYIIGIFRDITDKEIAEQQRKKLMISLQEKTADMQRFLFIVSHDLRAPLLNIGGFGFELIEDSRRLKELINKEQLSDRDKQELDMILDDSLPQSVKYIKSSVEKMDKLLAGLAELSRYGRNELQIEKLDMNQLVATAIESFQFQIDHANISIEIDDLPPGMGDSLGINQVFSNLIGNAIKYMDPNRKGLIEISGWTENNHCVYCIKDNGIGIPKIHLDRIFDVFHRVDPQSEVAGEGLGLSAVKNILTKNGGEVWLESEEGKGSTFYISLPASSV